MRANKLETALYRDRNIAGVASPDMFFSCRNLLYLQVLYTKYYYTCSACARIIASSLNILHVAGALRNLIGQFKVTVVQFMVISTQVC